MAEVIYTGGREGTHTVDMCKLNMTDQNVDLLTAKGLVDQGWYQCGVAQQVTANPSLPTVGTAGQLEFLFAFVGAAIIYFIAVRDIRK